MSLSCVSFRVVLLVRWSFDFGLLSQEGTPGAVRSIDPGRIIENRRRSSEAIESRGLQLSFPESAFVWLRIFSIVWSRFFFDCLASFFFRSIIHTFFD